MYETPFHTSEVKDYSFLITGGAGFIGSNIVKYLLKYNAGKICVLDNLSSGSYKNIEQYIPLSNFEFINGDIRDPEVCRLACKNIDFVSHQAALGSIPRSIKDPILTHTVNVNGFLNMIIAAKDAKVKRFIYASSSSVYGDNYLLPKVEDKIGQPLSPYAAGKQANELYARVFANLYNISCIGLRYFNVFGPGQSPNNSYAAVIPLFIKAFFNNESPHIYGDGEQTRDFTFVENVVQSNIKAFFSTHPTGVNKIYNIAVGERISINELAGLIQEITGSENNPIHSEQRAGDIRDSLASIEQAQKYLGYQPLIKIREGLEVTLDWYKARVATNC